MLTKNIKSNYIFYLAAICFSLSIYNYSESLFFLFLVIIGNWIFVFLQGNILHFFKGINKNFVWLSLFAAIGIDSYTSNTYSFFTQSNKVHNICCLLRLPNELLASTISSIVLFGSIVYLVFLLTKFYSWFYANIIQNILLLWEKKDYIVFGIIAILVLALILICYCVTTIFYDTNGYYDIMYTADSWVFFKENVWVNLYQNENNYRQPLFAVFSSPFLGPIYCIQKIFPITTSFCSVLIQFINVIFVIASFYLLMSKVVRKDMKWLAVIGYLSTYSVLLFVVVPEQYQMATAWLMIFLYECLNNRTRDTSLTLTAAMGTMTTSLALLPFVYEFSIKEIKKYIKNVAKALASCLLFIAMFNRFDIVSQYIAQRPTTLGSGIPIKDRFLQYINFAASWAFKPKSSIQTLTIYADALPGWHLDAVNHINILGVLIIIIVLLACLCEMKNRLKYNQCNRVVTICLYWLLNSFIILCIFGWGAWENGLVLYTLYYGWAFYLLIILLVKEFFEGFNIPVKKNVFIVACLVIVALLVFNLSGIFEMAIALRGIYLPRY